MHDEQIVDLDVRPGVKLSNKESPMRRGFAASLAVRTGGDPA
jgi:hypothetical protein